MKSDLTVISMLVWDRYGLLARVASLFSRKGHNIDNLTASNTDNPNQTRITITVQGDENEIRLIIAQCQKLEDVIDVMIMDTSKCVMREIVLIKVAAEGATRARVLEVAQIYKGAIVDLSLKTMIIEVTGKPEKIDAFVRVMEGDFEILEMCRTGSTAMVRNWDLINRDLSN